MSLKKKARESPIVIFDSSIMISAFECKVHLVPEIERVLSAKFVPTVLSGTLSEIEDVLRRSRGGKRKKQLMLALEIAKRFNRLEYNPLGAEEMDDVIMRAAKDFNAIVATNDGELRKRLVRAGAPVLFLREKSHIEAEGYLDDLATSLRNSSSNCQYVRD
jgi:rRNA-processing protein FCF1